MLARADWLLAALLVCSPLRSGTACVFSEPECLRLNAPSLRVQPRAPRPCGMEDRGGLARATPDGLLQAQTRYPDRSHKRVPIRFPASDRTTHAVSCWPCVTRNGADLRVQLRGRL